MKRVWASLLILVVVLSALAIGSYFLIDSSPDIPFNYQLSVSPISNTTTQGQTIKANITVAYLQGQAQPVNLLVLGNSTIMQTSLSNSTGTPKPNEPFTSNLTIHILASAQPDNYPVTITSNSGSTVHSTTCNLRLVSQIQVIGTVATNSTDDIYPTKLQFISQQNNVTYNATLSFSSLPNHKLQQQATYNVSLPNEQSYRVIGSWARLPGPWIEHSDLPEGTFDCGILQVDCRTGESSIVKDYRG
jgi:hypothetical protein